MDLTNPNKWCFDLEDIDESKTSDYWKNISKELDEEERTGVVKDEAILTEDGRWITIGHRDPDPENDDEGRKGRHLYLEDGETPEEAIEDLKDNDKEKKKDDKKDDADKKSEPEEKKESKNEEDDEFKDVSDEELSKRKQDVYDKMRKMQREENDYVDSDAEVVRLTKERDEIDRKLWNANPDDYASLDKMREKTLNALFDATYNAKERYRKEVGYWLDLQNEFMKLNDISKKRHENFEKDFDKKLDESEKKALDGNINDAIKDLLSLEKEAKSEKDIRTRWKLQEKVLTKVAKPIIESKSSKISDSLKKYNETTDKLLGSLAGYDKEFTQAQEDEQSFGKRANELWEKYKDKPEGEEKEKAFDELQKARFEYYNAMDKTAEKRKNLVYAFADKMRETYGDTGNKLGRVDKKSSPFCKEMNERLYKLFDGILGKDVDVSEAPRIRKTTAYRSCHKDNEGLEISKHSIDSNGALIHEYGHYLEEKNKGMLLNSLAFLTYRTKGEELKPMNHYEKGYRNEEKTRADKFFDPYCGKLYREFATAGDEYFNAKSSEIMSMGISRLFDNPTKFAKEDREYFNFVVANMRGEL